MALRFRFDFEAPAWGVQSSPTYSLPLLRVSRLAFHPDSPIPSHQLRMPSSGTPAAIKSVPSSKDICLMYLPTHNKQHAGAKTACTKQSGFPLAGRMQIPKEAAVHSPTERRVPAPQCEPHNRF
jgi:hypothetical protein